MTLFRDGRPFALLFLRASEWTARATGLWLVTSRTMRGLFMKSSSVDPWEAAAIDATDPPAAAPRRRPSLMRMARRRSTAQYEAAPRFDVHEHASMLHGTMLWDSARVLQAYVAASRPGGALGGGVLSNCAGKRVVELGAGCGVAGMAMSLFGARVTFTDKEELMDFLRDNVSRNLQSAGGELAARASFAPYLWGTDPHASGLHPPYDIVLATDPFVLDETREAFIHACRCCCGPSSIVVLAFQVRYQHVFDALLAALEAAAFDVIRVSEMRLVRANRSAGYSGTWIPLVLARLRPVAPASAAATTPAVDGCDGAGVPPPPLSDEQVRVASDAAEPGFALRRRSGF